MNDDLERYLNDGKNEFDGCRIKVIKDKEKQTWLE